MKTSQSIIKIAPALLEAQKKIGAAKKGSVNPFFHSNYADLGSVMEACKDILNENGILVLQPIGSDENGVYVETVLLHESGEYISDCMRIAPKSETNPQDQGSAISYARRYSLQSMVFIPAEDDDAEKATVHKQETQANENSLPSTPRSVLATPKQVALIYKLLADKGKSKELLKQEYKVESINDLPMGTASMIIDKLLKSENVPAIPVRDINDDLPGDNIPVED